MNHSSKSNSAAGLDLLSRPRLYILTLSIHLQAPAGLALPAFRAALSGQLRQSEAAVTWTIPSSAIYSLRRPPRGARPIAQATVGAVATNNLPEGGATSSSVPDLRESRRETRS